ncbi:MAG: hypothetical protein VW907_01920 [Opitutae bacterium]
MNAKDWNRIDDMLQQIRSKLANVQTSNEANQQRKNEALDYINALLALNETLAHSAYQGWL